MAFWKKKNRPPQTSGRVRSAGEAEDGATIQVGRPKPKARFKVWRRRLAKVSALSFVGLIALWIAIQEVPWLGPALADGVRAVVGPKPVAWAENVAYGIQDRVNLWRYEDEPPKDFWEMPAAEAAEPVVDPIHPDVAVAPFQPPRFTAPYPEVSTPADGRWFPIADPNHPNEPPRAFKAQVHPDPRRGFAALAVVALDAAAYQLHLVAGTKEPKTWSVKREDRPGTVAPRHHDTLFAAFNGGFKTTHGSYGMGLGDVDFLPPRDIACTFVHYDDGRYRIGVWSDLKKDRASMTYYRQTPPCLAENGKIHSLLHYHEYAKGWGATVSGDTVIRRSAIGLSKDGTIIYYGIGDAMTAQAVARGMVAAGAHSVAELDVNFSYPRFLMYEREQPDRPPMATSAIIPLIDYSKYQYVGQASTRDFFYLTREAQSAQRSSDRRTKLALTE